MLLEQLSIFLENRAGRMIEVTRVLAESNINILAMSLADTADFGILRLVVDDSEKAKRVLGEKGFTVGRTSVVAVRVNNEPGGLNRVLEIIQKASINVEYLYAYTQQGAGGQAVIVFRFDRNEQALEALMRGNIPVLSMKGMLAEPLPKTRTYEKSQGGPQSGPPWLVKTFPADARKKETAGNPMTSWQGDACGMPASVTASQKDDEKPGHEPYGHGEDPGIDGAAEEKPPDEDEKGNSLAYPREDQKAKRFEEPVA